MAKDDIEVELKFKLDEKDFLEVKKKLEETTKFIRKVEQSDEYFTPIHRDFLEPKFPYEWLSIRRRSNKIILNYKHWYPEGVEVAKYCDQFETEVKNSEQLEKILLVLNFKKLVRVEKKREVYMFDDEFEISLDNVKDLGYYVEIEALKDFGGIDKTREKLFDFTKKIGIDTSKIDKRGYPFLLIKKKGLI